jgi:hypothetical protein
VKRKICIIITITVLIIFAVFVFLFFKSSFSLSINGSKIDKDEFLNAASLKKYEAASYFSEKSGVNVDSNFWEREIDGELPYQKLADLAIEQIKYFHAVYGLAEEKGYIEDSSYQAFLERFELENKTRKEKIEKGEVVYGLSEYSQELYMEYEMDTIQKSYCGDLENEGMEVTDEDREQYYEKNIAYYKQDDDRILDYVKISYYDEGMDESKVDELRNTLTSIYKKMDKDHSLASLAKEEESIAPFLEHADVTAEELTIYSRTISDVLEFAWDLKSGESTAVLDENQCLYLIECTERKENGNVSLDGVKDNINKTLREERYDAIIEKRIEETLVEGDMEPIYSFMKKHIND